TGDPGLLFSCVVDTVNGSTATNMNAMAYTDQDGNTAQAVPTSPTLTFIVSGAASTANLGARVVCPRASSTTPNTYAFPLASGDVGARKIESITTSAANTGTIAFPMFHPLAFIPIATAGVISQVGFIADVPGLERVIDGAALNWWGYWPAA